MLMKWQDFLSRVTQAGNGSLGDLAELLRSVGAKETAVAKKTGTASSGAVTLAALAAKITTEALSTAAGSLYTLTITNSMVAADDIVMASVQNGSASAGSPMIEKVTVAAGSIVILVKNVHSSAAFNGTLKIAFVVHRVAD